MKKKNLFLICVTLAFTFFAFNANAGEEKITDQMIGKAVTLQSTLLIVENSVSSDSATAKKINKMGEDIGSIIGCAGCHHKSEQLTKVLTKGQQVTITDAYNDVPGFFRFGGSTIKYFIAKADSVLFVVPEYTLENAMTGDGTGDRRKVARYEQLLESFKDDQEVKDFYLNVKENMREVLFKNDKPPYSDQLIERHYNTILNGLTAYGASRGTFDRVLCGFPVTVNQRALAFIILNSADLYIDISPYQKL